MAEPNKSKHKMNEHWKFLRYDWFPLIRFFYSHKAYYFAYYQFFIIVYIIFIMTVVSLVAFPALYMECLHDSILELLNRIYICIKTWL
jgi:uncharacterized metal-binding protein